MKKNILKMLISVLCAAALVFLDQLTKRWAVENLMEKADIVWIKGVFQLHYLENRGMAFGLLQNRQLFFYIITVVILLAVLWFLWKTPLNGRFFPIIAILVLIMSGAVGNFIDRATQKYVIDFLYFSLIDFPVFNVADCYVTVSSFLLLVLIIFVYKDEELQQAYGRKKPEEVVTMREELLTSPEEKDG